MPSLLMSPKTPNHDVRNSAWPIALSAFRAESYYSSCLPYVRWLLASQKQRSLVSVKLHPTSLTRFRFVLSFASVITTAVAYKLTRDLSLMI